MAFRHTPAQRSPTRSWLVAVSLLALLAAALFLRVYWNMDAAQDEGGFILAGGSDPYYHKRAIDHIQETGETLGYDPMLNYPIGAVNPNPPLYHWTVAIAGKALAPMYGGDLGTATWVAFLWSSAVFGALTLIPIYFIGKSLLDRRTGLIAAAIWTLSTASIDTTGVGSADHDAIVLFFAAFAFLFYMKAIEQFRGDGNWVASWKNTATIGPGLARFFSERRLGLGYSVLAGISIGAVALIWKGFPYIIGILLAYAGIQMIVDHWRSRDSTGVFVGTLVAMLVGTLMALPYYAGAGVLNFVLPVWFLIGALAVAGLVLVPTRDLPTILVMPAALIAGIVGAVVAFFVVPGIAQSLLYAPVYFKRTSIYETIAEAHPADFSTMVFGVGPVAFFLAIVGWLWVLFTLRRHPGRAALFIVVWGGIAVFMAQSAVRFLFNAIPVFSVFAAYALVRIIDWLDFRAVRKTLAANQGNFWQGLRRGVRSSHVIAAILVMLLLVTPSVFLAADAAIPPSAEQRIYEESGSEFVKGLVAKRFGAYGQGFIPDYWRTSLEWLDTYNANVTDPAARPAFLAWWDYGHWAIQIGRVPATADNFQNGFEHAAKFILAQNETIAVQLLAARMLPLVSETRAEELLTAAGASDPAAARRSLLAFEAVPSISLAASVNLVDALEKETGKSIRFFAADVRMLPYDNPQTQGIEQSSIFYAPVKLARENPDDYVAVMIGVGNRFVTYDAFREMLSNPTRNIQATSERLDYKEAFFNSMYYRAYVGAPVPPGYPKQGDALLQALNSAAPGHGLEHFRLVYSNEGVKFLEYYPGAIIEGTVTQDGTPVSGATVTVYDDAGDILLDGIVESVRATLNPRDFDVPHAVAKTGADGKFRLVAPFATQGGSVTVVAGSAGVDLARATVAITRADANARTVFPLDIVIERGDVEGVAYKDEDGDGAFTAGLDTVMEGVEITIGDVSTVSGPDGTYVLNGVPPGRQTVTATTDTHEASARSGTVFVQPKQTATHNIALVTRPATVSGTAWVDLDGDGIRGEEEGAAFAELVFESDPDVEGNTAEVATPLVRSDGFYDAKLREGTYIVTIRYTAQDGTVYTATDRLTVVSGETVTRDFELT